MMARKEVHKKMKTNINEDWFFIRITSNTISPRLRARFFELLNGGYLA